MQEFRALGCIYTGIGFRVWGSGFMAYGSGSKNPWKDLESRSSLRVHRHDSKYRA